MPLTWELPTAIALSWLLLAFLALPGGQGVAAVLAGEGFVWPHGRLLHSLGGLLSGMPGSGLPSAERADLPAPFVVYAVIAGVELIVCTAGVWTMRLWWRTVGPGTQWGVARRHQVAPVLGSGNLRRRRRTIRPDLYGRKRRPW